MSTLTLAWPALPFADAPIRTPAMPEFAEPTDAELVSGTLQGDDLAFAELVRRHKRRVFGTASRFARDAHQLEDVCQEVFIKVFKNLAKFRGDAPFEHWLARITVSACYDLLRRERKYREQVSLDVLEHDTRDTTVEAALSAGRARELLAWAMRKLTADEQLILTLLEIEERSVREIAALTNWSESNVKVRAFRARHSLRKVLQLSHEI